MKYYVSVTETLNKVVSVDAENENEAIRKVKSAHRDYDLVLSSDDYVDDSASFQMEDDQEYYRNEEEQGYTEYQHID